MFKFLTSKKGFTLVELMIVIVLLSLGVVALGSLFRVAYRSYDKSEERYIKQEAVKNVASLLQTGTSSVSAAKTADIFADSSVVPQEADASFSYLFAEPGTDDEGNQTGYYLYVQNKGKDRNSAVKLSDVPIYVEIKPYFETKNKQDASGNEYVYTEQYNAVTVTLSALEDDYDYTSGTAPSSDDRFYSVDVAYHFPNMATSSSYSMVNHITQTEYSSASTYTENGVKNGTMQAIHCTQEKCSTAHCGCNCGKECELCNVCKCPEQKGLVLRVYCDSIISPDNTEAGIQIPSMCFIATASYGHNSGEVGMLCDFRDKCLLTNPLGTAFVKTYYKLSPPIADFIAEHETLKAAVRLALKPLVVVAEYSLNDEIAPMGIACFAVFTVCGLTSSAILVRVSKRKKRERGFDE